jgi:uncharacterized protein
MQLDLTRYRQPLSHFSRTFQAADVAEAGDPFQIVAPVEVDFDIHKDKDKFRLAGTVRTALELPCSRCLEPFRLPVDAAFDQRYLPSEEASVAPEHEVGEGDLETSFYRDDQIDLNELLREQFFLALPMKPLCTDECRGLCSQCGTNLNTGTCDCAPAWEDPRLAPLRTLGKKTDAES